MTRIALLLLTMAMLPGLRPHCAMAQQAESAQTPKTYPWDLRPAKCLLSTEALKSWTCKAPSDWPEYTEAIDHMNEVWTRSDFDLIERAANELAFSQAQFPSGRYFFEAWIKSTETTIQQTHMQGEKIVTGWTIAKGAEGMGSVTKAMVQYRRAWSARGHGFANTVNDEAWTIYYRKLADANRILDDASPRVKKSGPWIYLKLKIAYLHPDLQPSIGALMKEGVQSWPDCRSFYELAMDFSKPQWGGSYKQMEYVARLAADKSQAKWGMALYSTTYLHAYSEDESLSLRDSDIDWNMAKQGFRDMDARRGGLPGTWSGFAKLACLMRDRDEALRLYDIYDARYGNQNASSAGTDACRKFAYGGTPI